MTKARACVKSIKLRGALACAFLARAWGKLLCRWNWHDEQMGVWSDLHLDHPDGTTKPVGDRIEWSCARCGSGLRADYILLVSDRLTWNAHPERRRVTLRDWSKP